jgi:hypothetical protein
MQFMVLEMLNGKGHTYQQDLEPFFYVFIWTCIHYGHYGHKDLGARKEVSCTEDKAEQNRGTTSQTSILQMFVYRDINRNY